MKSYVTKFIRGLVGAFTRKPDGSLECTGLALTEESAAADPGVPPIRLGTGQDYIGQTVSGTPVIVQAGPATEEEHLADVAAQREFDIAKKIALRNESAVEKAIHRAAPTMTLLEDPRYQAARGANDVEEMSRIAA